MQYSLFLFLLVLNNIGTKAGLTLPESTVLELHASTPGDSLIKTMLKIDEHILIDFIRWDLRLLDEKAFTLSINYGVGEPNTLGFKSGGFKKSLHGEYSLEKNTPKGNVFHCRAKSGEKFSFLQLNEDLYHLLDADKRLLLGNGGWSYSLNRKIPVGNKLELPALLLSTDWVKNAPNVAVYDGRTPCMALADDYHIPVNEQCFKLKWRLTLFRDSITKQPTRYTLQRIFRRAQAIQGTWDLSKSNFSSATTIRLHPDKPADEALQFLVGDEGVLFFLDTKQRLMVGNEDFSYALNRKKN